MSISLEDALNELAPQLGGKSTTDMARLSGGASQETWAFKLDDGAGNLQKCILRRAPGGELREQSSTDIQLSDEAALIKAASAHGVEVPSVLHVCTEVDGLGAGFIMAHVEGETIARKILRDEKFQTARANLARQCGQALARIHSIPTDNLPEILPITTGTDQIAKGFTHLAVVIDHHDVPIAHACSCFGKVTRTIAPLLSRFWAEMRPP